MSTPAVPVVSAPAGAAAAAAPPVHVPQPNESENPNDYQIWRLVQRPGAKYFNLNPYEVLLLPFTATEEEIKKSYRKVPRLWLIGICLFCVADNSLVIHFGAS
jgi:hypothetical protein